jgi:hypothetical protein
MKMDYEYYLIFQCNMYMRNVYLGNGFGCQWRSILKAIIVNVRKSHTFTLTHNIGGHRCY